MDWPKIFSEAWRQCPAIALLGLALFTGVKGVWVFGSTYRTTVEECAADKAALKADLLEYKRIAFNSVGFLTERAQQSAKINDEATKPAPKSNAKPKAAVAVVKVPVSPVTTSEKKAIEKPKDAEAATLEKSLDASKKVLQKTDINNATVKKGTE